MSSPRGALVIVDLIEDFVDPEGALSCGDAGLRAAERAGEHLKAWRAEGLPVFHVTDRHRPDDAEFRFWPPHAVEGTWGARIHRSVTPAPGELIVPKRRFSGFFGTDLDGLLRESDLHELSICGVCTNICVLYTSVDAQMRGYDVSVLADACASYDAQAHAFALRELRDTIKVHVL